MRKNPPSFPGDGFFNEKQKVFFFPFVEQSQKGFRIGKYRVVHYANKVFPSQGFGIPRNVVENLSLYVDETALDCRVRIDFPYCREDARSAIDHEGFNAIPKGIPKDF